MNEIKRVILSMIIFLLPGFAQQDQQSWQIQQKKFNFGLGFKQEYSSIRYGDYGSSVAALNQNLYFNAPPDRHCINLAAKVSRNFGEYCPELKLFWQIPRGIKDEGEVNEYPESNITTAVSIDEIETGCGTGLNLKREFNPFKDKKSNIFVAVGADLIYKKATFDLGKNVQDSLNASLAHAYITSTYDGVGYKTNISAGTSWHLFKNFYLDFEGCYTPIGRVKITKREEKLDLENMETKLKETRTFEYDGAFTTEVSITKRF